jgi:thioredoxin reductase (NADPH)
VRVRTGTEVVGGGGEGGLEELVLRDRATGDEKAVAADALFVMIGARPRSDWLPPEVARDERGFLLPLETSMPGVLAAGDVRHGSVKRVASAVGEGANAVQLVLSILADPDGAASDGRAPAQGEWATRS